MRRLAILFAALPLSALWIPACGDDTVTLPYQDGAPDRTATTFEAASPVEAGDAVAAEAGDASDGAVAPPSRLLLSFNGSSQSELVAFGLASKKVDGRLVYGDYLGTTYVAGGAPWLLEQSTDLVARMDAQKPWSVDASWNVAMSRMRLFSRTRSRSGGTVNRNT